MIIEIQCLPSPSGTPRNRYEHIEAAIAVVAEAGLSYEVSALGTTFEGPSDACWALARAAHEACLASGADSVVTVVKIAEGDHGDGEASMDGLAGPHRR